MGHCHMILADTRTSQLIFVAQARIRTYRGYEPLELTQLKNCKKCFSGPSKPLQNHYFTIFGDWTCRGQHHGAISWVALLWQYVQIAWP